MGHDDRRMAAAGNRSALAEVRPLWRSSPGFVERKTVLPGIAISSGATAGRSRRKCPFRMFRAFDINEIPGAGTFGCGYPGHFGRCVAIEACINRNCQFGCCVFHKCPSEWRIIGSRKSQESVERWLPFCPGLPARMNPNPLFGVLSNDLFNYVCKSLGILENIWSAFPERVNSIGSSTRGDIYEYFRQ
jgi:hypothetical protein